MTPSITVPGATSSHVPYDVVLRTGYTEQLTAIEYAKLVHPKGGTGVVVFGGPQMSKKVDEKGKARSFWVDRRWSPHALATRPVDLTGQRFMTFATYPYHRRGEAKPKKVEENIVSIGASWLDLDYYNAPAWQGVLREQVIESVLNIIEDAGWPRPSYINTSGRGLLVVWLYPSQSRVILPRHRAVQKAMHSLFKPMGADRSAITPTKTFRMVRTYNEKSGAMVRMVWPATVVDIERTTFDVLAGAVLPMGRTEVADRKKAKAQRAPRPPRAKREGALGARIGGKSYWATLREDLDRLFAIRFGAGPIPDGAGRNLWVTHLAYAAAWAMPASELDAYVRAQAGRCGLTETEALAKTVSIRARAQESAKGIKKSYDGRMVDPRYRPAPATFRDALDITSAEMRKADLRMLVDAARRQSNAVGRAVKARRAAGVGSRDVSQDTRRAVGAAALDLKAQGLTNAEVCEVFDVGARYLDTALRDARAVATIGKTRKAKPARAGKALAEAPPQTPVSEPSPVDAPAHEVLRGTKAVRSLLLAAGGHEAYRLSVKAEGTYFHQTDARCGHQARRASSCPEMPAPA